MVNAQTKQYICNTNKKTNIQGLSKYNTCAWATGFQGHINMPTNRVAQLVEHRVSDLTLLVQSPFWALRRIVLGKET